MGIFMFPRFTIPTKAQAVEVLPKRSETPTNVSNWGATGTNMV
jgi:hypothetical protein